MFRELMTEEIFLPLLSERAGVRPNSPSFTPLTHHFCKITSSSGKNIKKQNAWSDIRAPSVVPSFWKEGLGVAKREEGAMRGAQRRGKRQIRFDLS